jgi:hypothetical protein
LHLVVFVALLRVLQPLEEDHYLFIFLFQFPLKHLLVVVNAILHILGYGCDEALLADTFPIVGGTCFATVLKVAQLEEISKLSFQLFSLALLLFLAR